jgi:hypothetical protein
MHLLWTRSLKTSDAFCAISTLHRQAGAKVAHGTGISSCLDGAYIPEFIQGDYTPAIDMAVKNVQGGAAAFSYIWTLDSTNLMRKFLDHGVDAILTNFPGRLAALVRERRLRIATSDSLCSCPRPKMRLAFRPPLATAVIVITTLVAAASDIRPQPAIMPATACTDGARCRAVAGRCVPEAWHRQGFMRPWRW